MQLLSISLAAYEVIVVHYTDLFTLFESSLLTYIDATKLILDFLKYIKDNRITKGINKLFICSITIIIRNVIILISVTICINIILITGQLVNDTR